MCIDCNEVGFSKKNVKAICSIGQSTKKAADRTKGFIGERELGSSQSLRLQMSFISPLGPFNSNSIDERPLV